MAVAGAAGAQDPAPDPQEKQVRPPDTTPLLEATQPPQKAVPLKDIFDVIRELRHKPPPLGTLVTYRYRELTPHGMPRFPRYLRLRDIL